MLQLKKQKSSSIEKDIRDFHCHSSRSLWPAYTLKSLALFFFNIRAPVGVAFLVPIFRAFPGIGTSYRIWIEPKIIAYYFKKCNIFYEKDNGRCWENKNEWFADVTRVYVWWCGGQEEKWDVEIEYGLSEETLLWRAMMKLMSHLRAQGYKTLWRNQAIIAKPLAYHC